MDRSHQERLTDTELRAFFDQLLPRGFAGADVLSEIAPEGWMRSPLLACFHPSVERLFEERLQTHRTLDELRCGRRRCNQTATSDDACVPAPTLEDVRREYRSQPVQQDEEVTELVGDCLWDVFSNNHDVFAPDGRLADIGSFRGASAFLDEYANRDSRRSWSGGDCMRFYMGSIWISGRADLTPVYGMIFRRLRSLGADWVYHFSELESVDIVGPNAREPQAERQPMHAATADINARARQDATTGPPPAAVRAYSCAYGRDPRGWPPA
jgi:hypothetical protein